MSTMMGGITGGIFDLAGAAIEENAAKEMAKKSRDFAAKMRNTQYQAAVKDLRAAGLNPILAARFGGSGGASAPMAKPGSWAGIGSRAAANVQQGKLIEAQKGALDAQAGSSAAVARNQNAQGVLNELKAAEQGVRNKIWTSGKQALDWIESNMPTEEAIINWATSAGKAASSGGGAVNFKQERAPDAVAHRYRDSRGYKMNPAE